MLEKNKDYIELKAACCSADYCQGYMTHLDITGYSNSDLATPLPNPGTDYILISKEKFDRLQANVGINEELAKQWEINYDLLLKKTGFDTVEELVNYLDSEAECETLHDDILKLHDEVKYANDKWASAISSNNSWKAAAECNSPKTLMTKLNLLRGSIKEWKEETGIYKRALKEWKETTGCPSPSSAKTLIESGASWHYAYNESKKVNKKFADSIKAWQNVTGYATPEDYLAAVIKNTAKAALSWQEITGFSTPEKCSSYIDTLEEKLEDIKNLIEED